MMNSSNSNSNDGESSPPPRLLVANQGNFSNSTNYLAAAAAAAAGLGQARSESNSSFSNSQTNTNNENSFALGTLSPTHSRHNFNGNNNDSDNEHLLHHQTPWTQYPLAHLLAYSNSHSAIARDDDDDDDEEDSEDEGPPDNLMVQEEQKTLLHELDQQKQLKPFKSLRSAIQKNLNAFGGPIPSHSTRQDQMPTPTLTSPTATDGPLSTGSNRSPRPRSRLSDPEQAPEEDVQNIYELEMDDKTRALYIWSKIDNLDEFLSRIYSYFVEKGFYAVILARICNLIILAFMVGFSTFAFSCIDHTRIHKHKNLADVIVPECFKTLPAIQTFFLVFFSVWWLWQLIQLLVDIPRLFEIKLIYTHLLDIPEDQMDSVEWQEVVEKVSQIPHTHPEANPQQQQALDNLDAHAIVARIMRKENYLIAMFNMDVLNLRVPGVLGRWAFGRKYSLLTKVVEWNLHLCILMYAFDEKGQLRKRFLKNSFRRRLIVGLQKRFELMSILNLLFAPFVLVVTLLYFIFKSTEEYQKSPSALGARGYTLHAHYKLREFNELPHIFSTRLNKSYPLAVKYLDQFRKQKQIIVARLISFIAGSLVAALALLAVVEQELTDFEITPGRSALFYMTVFGGVLAVVRGMIPEETRVFEPAGLLKEVVEETHYLPDEWRGKLHTEEVKNQFSKLFDLKLTHLLLEIASIPLAPFVLYYSLPQCAESIVDFFREHTVEMDGGVGFVCSFSAFDLARHGNPKYGVPTLQSDGYGGPEGGNQYSKEGKMEQSFLYFKANYPQWEVGVDGSQYLQALSRSVGPQQLLKPEASILLDPAGGANGSMGSGGGTVRSRRNVKFGGQIIPASPLRNWGTAGAGGVRNIHESRLGMSSMDRSGMIEGEEGIGLFALLDAMHSNNNAARMQ